MRKNITSHFLHHPSQLANIIRTFLKIKQSSPPHVPGIYEYLRSRKASQRVFSWSGNCPTLYFSNLSELMELFLTFGCECSASCSIFSLYFLDAHFPTEFTLTFGCKICNKHKKYCDMNLSFGVLQENVIVALYSQFATTFAFFGTWHDAILYKMRFNEQSSA